MSSILSQPGFWVGTLVAVAFTLTIGVVRDAPWWRTAVGALGAVAFVAGLQWALGSGPEAFLAAGLASLGMAVWGETAVALVEWPRRTEVATTLVPITGEAEPIRPQAAPRPRRAPAARPTAPTAVGTRPSPRAKPVAQVKPKTRTKRVAQAKSETRPKRAARAAPGPR